MAAKVVKGGVDGFLLIGAKCKSHGARLLVLLAISMPRIFSLEWYNNPVILFILQAASALAALVHIFAALKQLE